MSLKQKVESAARLVLQGSGLFGSDPDWTVQFLRSQENQTANRNPPCCVAVFTETGQVTDKKGQPTGTVDGRLDLIVYGLANKQEGSDTDPEDDHAEVVQLVRNAWCVSDLAEQLSAAVADFTCLHALYTPPGVLSKPEEDCFVDVFSRRVRVLETDCT